MRRSKVEVRILCYSDKEEYVREEKNCNTSNGHNNLATWQYQVVKTRSTPELSLECPEISFRWDLASVTQREALCPCQVFVLDFRMWR